MSERKGDLLQIAAAMVRGTNVCEKPHRNGEANPHIHFNDQYIATARRIRDAAYALSATPPASETVEAARVKLLRHITRGHGEGVVQNALDDLEAAIRAESDERVRALRGLLREAADNLLDTHLTVRGELQDRIRAALDATPEDAHKRNV